jgi:DNA invertase Pin-like site-specific DNA recombinase
MTALLIGYARCSTDEQDLTVQREGLAALGVTADRIYVDHGLTGRNRDRPASTGHDRLDLVFGALLRFAA